MDKQAADIPADYRRKAAKIDAALGVEVGPCLRRLSELPLMTLCWGHMARIALGSMTWSPCWPAVVCAPWLYGESHHPQNRWGLR